MAQGAGQGACHHENKRHRPCSLAARGTPYSLFRPPQKARGWRAKWRVMQFKCTPSHRRCGASRRAIAAFSLRRRAALSGSVSSHLRLEARGAFRVNRFLRASGKPQRPAVSQLLAGGHSASGRSPGAARVQEERSSPARGRRSLLRSMTPHEAPLTSEEVGSKHRFEIGIKSYVCNLNYGDLSFLIPGSAADRRNFPTLNIIADREGQAIFLSEQYGEKP